MSTAEASPTFDLRLLREQRAWTHNAPADRPRAARQAELVALHVTVVAFEERPLERPEGVRAWVAYALQTGTSAYGRDEKDAAKNVLEAVLNTMEYEWARKGTAPEVWFERSSKSACLEVFGRFKRTEKVCAFQTRFDGADATAHLRLAGDLLRGEWPH